MLRTVIVKTLQRRQRNAEAGFSLIEIMVVVFIMGLLSTAVLVTVLPNQDRAMTEKARADIRTMEQAIELYRMEMLTYPSIDQGLEALVRAPEDLDRPERYREGGYIRDLPEDPWGSPYQYMYPGEFSAFDIYSLGADGRQGGEGMDADIGNWNEDDRR